MRLDGLPSISSKHLDQENTLRRRSFIAALPLAVTGSIASVHPSSVLAQSGEPKSATPDAPLPKFQPAGAERFERPDVHAGDRVSGASFASRSAAMGCSGAAGTAHPIATLTAIEILKRGGSAIDAAIAANACLGFLEPTTSSGIGGDCYAMIWDPQALQGRQLSRLRTLSQIPHLSRPPAHAPKTESSRPWERSPSPPPVRSMPGGRSTNATAN